MKYKLTFTILFCTIFSCVFGQLEFTSQERLLFVGADSIEGKYIISGVYITPIDSFNLQLNMDIMDDWKLKDTISIFVDIDVESIKNDNFFIFYYDTLPCYRFYNSDGFEVFIAKEKFSDNYNQYGEFINRSYDIHSVQLYLPQKMKFYVKTLPLMFQK